MYILNTYQDISDPLRGALEKKKVNQLTELDRRKTMAKYFVKRESGKVECTKEEAKIWEKYGFEVEIVWDLQDFNSNLSDPDLAVAFC